MLSGAVRKRVGDSERPGGASGNRIRAAWASAQATERTGGWAVPVVM
jgi:hypothetical protein